MNENLLGERILGCALWVHRALGPGLLEGAYEACLAYELTKSGLASKRQLAMPVQYEGVQVELGYRLGYLLNFNVPVLKDGIVRLANGL